MQIGCSVSLQDIPLAEKAGFDFVELQVGTLLPEMGDDHFNSIQQTVSECAIPVKSFNAFLPPHIPVVGPQADRPRYEAFVTIALRRIHALGGERVSFGSGHSRSCPPDFPRERAEGQIVQFLECTADIAGQYGIRVNVEGLNRTECNMINSLLDANRYVEYLNCPNVSLIADFYHMQMENEPLEHLIEVKQKLNYVHVADTGRFYPGSGNYPFEALMGMLLQIGYTGPISVECTWRNIGTEISKAGQFLKSITRQG